MKSDYPIVLLVLVLLSNVDKANSSCKPYSQVRKNKSRGTVFSQQLSLAEVEAIEKKSSVPTPSHRETEWLEFKRKAQKEDYFIKFRPANTNPRGGELGYYLVRHGCIIKKYIIQRLE